MTALSVNLNKIALLRNSRGRDYPNLLAYARQVIDLGVAGITVHPRQDERHTKRQDVFDLVKLTNQFNDVEFNVEGYPEADFLQLIEQTKPQQCTLVPDSPNQLTSDHGWDLRREGERVKQLAEQLRQWGVRSSVFLDPDLQQVELAAACGVDRIELYTEAYAEAYVQGDCQVVLKRYREATELAQSLGLGVNAGHDLDLQNLSTFLTIPNILEVSIGHALTIESLQFGYRQVIADYLKICQQKRD